MQNTYLAMDSYVEYIWNSHKCVIKTYNPTEKRQRKKEERREGGRKEGEGERKLVSP